jgi:hypothetical protein
MHLRFLNNPRSGSIHIMSDEDFANLSPEVNLTEVEFLEKKLVNFDTKEFSGYRSVKFWGWFPSFDVSNLKKQLNRRDVTKNVIVAESPGDQDVDELDRFVFFLEQG